MRLCKHGKSALLLKYEVEGSLKCQIQTPGRHGHDFLWGRLTIINKFEKSHSFSVRFWLQKLRCWTREPCTSLRTLRRSCCVACLITGYMKLTKYRKPRIMHEKKWWEGKKDRITICKCVRLWRRRKQKRFDLETSRTVKRASPYLVVGLPICHF